MNDPTSPKRAFFFDLDGVLFNSMPAHAEAWTLACRKFGIPFTPEDAFLHEGRTGADTINLLSEKFLGHPATEQQIRDIYAEKSRIFDAYPLPAEMEGARRVLEAVKRQGKLIYCVTGSGQSTILAHFFEMYGEYFTRETLVCSLDYRLGKPNPDPYLIALHRAGIAAEQAVVIENAPLGIRAAVAAGIETWAVNTGPIPPQALWDERPTRLFTSMNQLADFLAPSSLNNP